jgi:hypothetical protein
VKEFITRIIWNLCVKREALRQVRSVFMLWAQEEYNDTKELPMKLAGQFFDWRQPLVSHIYCTPLNSNNRKGSVM